MTVPADIPGFFVRYAEAFSAFDPDRLTGFLEDQLVVVTEDRTHSFMERHSVRANMEGLLRVYRRLGIERAVPVTVLGQPYANNPALAGAEVAWSMQDRHGRQIIRFSTGYMLRRRGGDWRIAIAVAHDEPAKLAKAVAALDAAQGGGQGAGRPGG